MSTTLLTPAHIADLMEPKNGVHSERRPPYGSEHERPVAQSLYWGDGTLQCPGCSARAGYPVTYPRASYRARGRLPGYVHCTAAIFECRVCGHEFAPLGG